MSLHRRNPRRDKCEPEIVKALQSQGFHVTRISGAGVPDLLVSKQGRQFNPATCRLDIIGLCWLVEVKTPKGRMRPAQNKFRLEWLGPPIITLRSVDDALKFQLLAMEGA